MNIEKLNHIKEILIKMEEHRVQLSDKEKVYNQLLAEDERNLWILAKTVDEDQIKNLYSFYFTLEEVDYKRDLLIHLRSINQNKSLNTKVVSAFLELNPTRRQMLAFIEKMKNTEKVDEMFLFIVSFFKEGLGGFSKQNHKQLLKFLEPFYQEDAYPLNKKAIKEEVLLLKKLQQENKLLERHYLTEKEMLELVSIGLDNKYLVRVLASDTLIYLLEKNQMSASDYRKILDTIKIEEAQNHSINWKTNILTCPNLKSLVFETDLSMKEVISLVCEKNTDYQNWELNLRMFYYFLFEEWSNYCVSTHQNPLHLCKKFTSLLENKPYGTQSGIENLLCLAETTGMIEMFKNNSLSPEENNQQLEKLITYLTSIPSYNAFITTLRMLENGYLFFHYSSCEEIVEQLKALNIPELDIATSDILLDLVSNNNFEDFLSKDITRYEILPYIANKAKEENRLCRQKLDTISNILTSSEFNQHFQTSLTKEDLQHLTDIVFDCKEESQLNHLYMVSTEKYKEISPSTYFLLLHFMKDETVRHQDERYPQYGEYIAKIEDMLEKEENKTLKKTKPKGVK